MTKEELYDQQVAPKLLELSKLCSGLGLPFVAAVEYAPYCIGRTVTLPVDSGIAILMVDLAAQAHGNADVLIMGMMRYSQMHGHQSACLRILGVPEGTPDNAPATAAAITVTG